MVRQARLACLLFAAVAGALPSAAAARVDGGLPKIGPAPAFTLTTQNGAALSLAQLRGKVVVVNFIYASCKDVCQTGTARLAKIQSRLGEDFGSRAFFVSISLDAPADSPAALKRFAASHGAMPVGWAFLSGPAGQVKAVARGYGVAFRKVAGAGIEHNTLTSLIDRNGVLRVQYLGVQFDPEEMLADIRSLIAEGDAH